MRLQTVIARFRERKSHQYDFRPAEVARLLGGALLPALIFAALIRLGAVSGLLPSPWPALDVDHTILTHQARASARTNGADVLLIGDSSCLMDVSGKGLETALNEQHQVLNLGTFMYVGLNGYAALLTRYASVNPGSVRAVVVLLHPEMLRGIEPVPSYLLFISDYYAGVDYSDGQSIGSHLRGFFGLNVFQDRLLSHLPLALPKEYGRYYGFNLDLDQFMTQHHGSAVDPHHYEPSPGQGNAEFRLAPALEPGGMALKAAAPPQAKLFVGLTPIPESFAPAGYSERCQTLLSQWGQWAGADQLLTNLPPTLPDSNFASTTHLNEQGALLYTEILAKCLAPWLAKRE